MAFDRKYLSNASATGNSANVFTYGNVQADGTAPDATAAIIASGYFDDAVDVLKKGNIIIISDGATTATKTVTSETGATPVTVG
jgi:hypothetical protein